MLRKLLQGSLLLDDGNYVQIVNLLSRHCPLLKSWLEDQRLKPYSTTYMSSESQNEMVHLLAQEVKKKIKGEINSAGIFSVSADTTPDTLNQDQLVVGGLNGAQNVLQDMLERPVPYIPYKGHRSNTLNEHCCKPSPIITSMYNVLEDIRIF